MKLGLVLVSCDLKPQYLEFWPLVHRAWEHLVKVRCIMILVAESLPENLEYTEDVILFPPVPGIHTALQAQCLRMLYPGLITNLGNEGILISDMDMIPMSPEYFIESIGPYDSDLFITYRGGEDKRIYICYNVASSQTWSEIWGVYDEQQLRGRLQHWNKQIFYEGRHGGEGWSTDELQLYSAVQTWRSGAGAQRFAALHDRQLGFYRLDRQAGDGPADISNEIFGHIGRYTDYHMNFPYSQYQPRLEKIYELTLAFWIPPPT